MINQIQILENAGLSKNEAKVYLELMNLGQTTVVDISRKTKLHRTNVYDSLDRLIEKGLVAHITKNGTKLFEAANPENLLSLLKTKETELKSIIPTLSLNYGLGKKISSTCVFEGIQAVKNVLDMMLGYNEPIYVYGVPNHVADMIGGFLLDFHKRRIKNKIFMYHVYNENAQDRIKYLNSLQYTEAKFLDKEYNSPIATNICGDSIVLILYTKNPLVVHINNKEIAAAYKKYFDILWALAKKQ